RFDALGRRLHGGAVLVLRGEDRDAADGPAGDEQRDGGGCHGPVPPPALPGPGPAAGARAGAGTDPGGGRRRLGPGRAVRARDGRRGRIDVDGTAGEAVVAVPRSPAG